MAARSNEYVILLHGWGRSEKSMLLISHQLKKAGYGIVNINYPSNDKPIAELADLAVAQGIAECEARDAKVIHFVTHSLGGILVRHYFEDRELDTLGRVVMLGTPNHGSEVVDAYKKLYLFRQLAGPAGLALGTSEQDVPNQLGAVSFELGVIAGSKSINPFLSLLLPGDDDGKVSVESTKVEGMTDFITLPTTHPTMLISPAVIKQVIHFLRHGNFNN
ncbi:triacylglycerol lipase [Psychrobium sp. 1_MG-2023]|uniref:esterase/lipase family protein n=1 Tax=Psychrobium sp. 1_MG-2023 TaxID=3062624 RepID=UPI000C33C6B8|nr:alpha/beta fold hydrolase [Psychrobium sp. 1_MG-2023]MDP2562130.1 alpha/beta hydrolase [Psychrobium sp. 1_MG-2023]PKF57193.1 alpha/beta hydrolase [Alteromonadales bacterium alter-6D02]